MAFTHMGHRFSKKAAVDLSTAGQNRFVKDNGSGESVLCGLGDLAEGVCLNDPELGQTATIQSSHHVKITTGGSIAVDAVVASDASGNAKVAGSGDYPLGVAKTASGGAGEVITIDLQLTLTPLA